MTNESEMETPIEEYLREIGKKLADIASATTRIADNLDLIIDKETGNLLHSGHVSVQKIGL